MLASTLSMLDLHIWRSFSYIAELQRRWRDFSIRLLFPYPQALSRYQHLLPEFCIYQNGLTYIYTSWLLTGVLHSMKQLYNNIIHQDINIEHFCYHSNKTPAFKLSQEFSISGMSDHKNHTIQTLFRLLGFFSTK